VKKLIAIGFIAVIMALSIGQAIATKPGEETNPNGFPSGPHFNLNIIGKKAEFVCPEQEYYLKVDECNCGDHAVGDLVKSCSEGDKCVETNIPIYGKVVFVPENGEGIEIYMESGKGKKAAAITDLQAIDPCAGFDGDGATIQLPKNEYGYRVYTRALAKPGEDTYIKITPSLVMVEDEYGDDLVYLGIITDSGFQLPESEKIERRKGPSRAFEITGLFTWTGTICYLNQPDESYSETLMCCKEIMEPPYYECVVPTDSTCPEVYTLTTVYCKSYEGVWVFNIADFVTYLWSVDNKGTKLLQVRFYPNDGAESAPPMYNTLTIQWGKIKDE
jgi:hypothetical protein